MSTFFQHQRNPVLANSYSKFYIVLQCVLVDCATKWSFESVPVNLWLSTQTCPDQLNVWPTASATLDFRQCGRCALNVELLSTHWTSVILIWLRAPHRHLYPGLMSIFINPGESTDSGITREIRIGPPKNNVKTGRHLNQLPAFGWPSIITTPSRPC